MFPDLLPGKHLLLDNHVWGDVYRLTRVLHRPRMDPMGPVMEPEYGWEGDYVTPLHVMYDAGRKRYRMWYQAHVMALEEVRKKLGKSKYGNVGEPQPIYMCYAESGDGVKWERPSLGIYPEDGGKNSIVFKGYSYVAGNTVVDRGAAAVGSGGVEAEKRWVLANCEWFSGEVGGLILAYSADGLHWKYPAGKVTGENPAGFRPLIHGESDTWNSLVWNAERGVWMVYMRAWHSAAVGWPNGKGNARRRVAYSESKDLEHWAEPQIIYTPDELDTDDFYGLQVFRYADYFLGALWQYDEGGRETIHAELAWSRDGVEWRRLPGGTGGPGGAGVQGGPCGRPAYIPHDLEAGSGTFMIIPAQEPVTVGDELYVYWTGHKHPHSATVSKASAYRGRLRMDGFVSLVAGEAMGNLVTRPFVIGDGAIRMNAVARAGRIVAELVEPYWHDPEGKPIEGFGAKEFDVFTGDETGKALSWRGRSDLSALKGKRVLLRMALVGAEIYSLTV